MSDESVVLTREEMEVLSQRNPEEVEREIVQEQVAGATTDYDPMEAAAKIFTMYLPQYKQLVRRMSNRQMRRLLCALIEVPLQKQDYRHPTKEEQAAFMIGDRLLQAKWTMVTHTLMAKLAQEVEQQKQNESSITEPSRVSESPDEHVSNSGQNQAEMLESQS